MTLPNNIKKLRDARELTLEQVAERTGLSVGYIARLEKADRNLSHKNMRLIAQALGCAVSDLIATPESQPPANQINRAWLATAVTAALRIAKTQESAGLKYTTDQIVTFIIELYETMGQEALDATRLAGNVAPPHANGDVNEPQSSRKKSA